MDLGIHRSESVQPGATTYHIPQMHTVQPGVPVGFEFGPGGFQMARTTLLDDAASSYVGSDFEGDAASCHSSTDSVIALSKLWNTPMPLVPAAPAKIEFGPSGFHVPPLPIEPEMKIGSQQALPVANVTSECKEGFYQPQTERNLDVETMSSMRLQLLFGSDVSGSRGFTNLAQQEKRKSTGVHTVYDDADSSSNMSGLGCDDTASAQGSEFSTISCCSEFSMMSCGSAWGDLAGETTTLRKWTTPASKLTAPKDAPCISKQSRTGQKDSHQGKKKDKIQQELQKLQMQLKETLHLHLKAKPRLPEQSCDSADLTRAKVLLPLGCWTAIAHQVFRCLPCFASSSLLPEDQFFLNLKPTRRQTQDLQDAAENGESISDDTDKLKNEDSSESKSSELVDPWGIAFLMPGILSLGTLGNGRLPAGFACTEQSDVEANLQILKMHRDVHIVVPTLIRLITAIQDAKTPDQIAVFHTGDAAITLLRSARGSTSTVRLLTIVVLFSAGLRNFSRPSEEQSFDLLGSSTVLQVMELLLHCIRDIDSVDQRTQIIAEKSFTLMFHCLSFAVQDNQPSEVDRTLASSILRVYRDVRCTFLRSAILFFLATVAVKGGRPACKSLVSAGVIPRVSIFSSQSRQGDMSEEPAQLLLLSILVARSDLARQQLGAVILALPHDVDVRWKLELQGCMLPSRFR